MRAGFYPRDAQGKKSDSLRLGFLCDDCLAHTPRGIGGKSLASEAGQALTFLSKLAKECDGTAAQTGFTRLLGCSAA